MILSLCVKLHMAWNTYLCIFHYFFLYPFVKLFSFLGPLEIIISWFGTCCCFDDPFQTGPESNQFQWVIEPSSGNAKVSFMWHHMVDTVVLSGQDDVPILQLLHPQWQTKISVRPLVNLISQSHKDNENKEETVGGIRLFYRLLVMKATLVDNVTQDGQSCQAIVSICFNNIMSCDGCGIHMMLTEWTDECLREKKWGLSSGLQWKQFEWWTKNVSSMTDWLQYKAKVQQTGKLKAADWKLCTQTSLSRVRF